VTSPSSQPQVPRKGRSLTGFYIGLGVVALLLGLGVWLAPVVQPHYHSWKFRTGDDHNGKHLAWAVDHLASRNVAASAALALLGKPDRRIVAEYDMSKVLPYFNYDLDGQYAIGYLLVVQDGRVVQFANKILRRRWGRWSETRYHGVLWAGTLSTEEVEVNGWLSDGAAAQPSIPDGPRKPKPGPEPKP
jgi:hypothetical protein